MAGILISPVSLAKRLILQVCVLDVLPLIKLKFLLWLLLMILKSLSSTDKSGSSELSLDFICRIILSSILKTVRPVDAVTFAKASVTGRMIKKINSRNAGLR